MLRKLAAKTAKVRKPFEIWQKMSSTITNVGFDNNVASTEDTFLVHNVSCFQPKKVFASTHLTRWITEKLANRWHLFTYSQTWSTKPVNNKIPIYSNIQIWCSFPSKCSTYLTCWTGYLEAIWKVFLQICVIKTVWHTSWVTQAVKGWRILALQFPLDSY